MYRLKHLFNYIFRTISEKIGVLACCLFASVILYHFYNKSEELRVENDRLGKAVYFYKKYNDSLCTSALETYSSIYVFSIEVKNKNNNFGCVVDKSDKLRNLVVEYMNTEEDSLYFE